MHAYDWNCPQHIAPRYSAAELAPALAPLHEELARLRAENADLRRRASDAAVTGAARQAQHGG